MPWNPLDTIIGYLKDQPYWKKIEAPLTFLSLYVSTLVLAYQYIEWQYGFSPPLGLYVSSYVVKQLTLMYLAIGTIIWVFTHQRREKSAELGSFQRRMLTWRRQFGRRLLAATVITICSVTVFIYISPHRVRHIEIRFLGEPDFDKYAFVYTIYELNRQQQSWHFDVQFDTFDSEAVSTEDEKTKCQSEPLCYARLLAVTRRDMGGLIGITTQSLGQDSFWKNDRTTSVVSTFHWQDYAPPGVYDYLAYSIIIQSILIHLNGQCGGLPESAFEQSRSAYGDLFEFSPRRHEIKAEILTAHLSPSTQELLSNCFGLEYMNRCNQLLSLAWLHNAHVQDNMQRAFHVRP